MVGGYIICLILKAAGIFDMSFAAVAGAAWVNIPYVTQGFMSIPKFDWMVILSIAPIALVTFMEHVGDITANGAVVGKDFFKDPGLHRTLLGDGLATLVAGIFGGPPNTTYSENTGVLAATKNYNPKILRVAAVFAIILGFSGNSVRFCRLFPMR
jgi:uracil permease